MKLLPIALALLGFAADRPAADFSASWKQSNEGCSPRRTGDVTLKIQHRDPEQVLETTSKGLITPHALQRHSTDGAESKSIGADGDEFHSIVIWMGDALVFDIVRGPDSGISTDEIVAPYTAMGVVNRTIPDQSRGAAFAFRPIRSEDEEKRRLGV